MFNAPRHVFMRDVVGTIDVFLHKDGFQVAVRNLHLGCLKYTAERASERVLELNHAVMQLADKALRCARHRAQWSRPSHRARRCARPRLDGREWARHGGRGGAAVC